MVDFPEGGNPEGGYQGKKSSELHFQSNAMYEACINPVSTAYYFTMACQELQAQTFLRTLADLYALSSRVRILWNYVLIKANFTH